MSRTARTHRLLAVGVTAALLLSGTALAPAPASAVAGPVPTAAPVQQTDRDAAVKRFYDTLVPALDTPIGWTGEVASCNAGTISPAARSATLTAVNTYRTMLGLGTVTFDPALDAKAQQAALMMHANGTLEHTPPTSWTCYTADGAEAAGKSNLHSDPGAQSIRGYLDDPGSTNTQVGHRRLVLMPTTTTMGIGSTSDYSALWTVGPTSESQPRPEWIPWPNAGFVPVPMEPGGRWSLGSSDQTTDFANATVSVTGPQGALSVTRYTPTKYFVPTLVWDVTGLPARGSLAADTTFTVKVSGVRRGSTTLADVVYPVTLVPARPLVNTVLPTVSGEVRENYPLQATSGTWSPAPRPNTYRYQWLRDGVPIAGETKSSYKQLASDAGRSLSVTVTAFRADYADTSVTVRATGAATDQPFSEVGTPAVTGTPTVGQSLTAQPGTWTPTPTLAYQWLRNGTAISEATGATYAVAAADAGTQVSVQVTGSRSGYVTTSQTSAAVAVPLRQFASVGTPTVTGTPDVGQTLTAQPGTWSPTPTFAYQWLRDGTAIAGATTSTYAATTADAGKRVSVRVSGTSPGYVPTVRTSDGLAVPVRQFTSVGTPTVTGTPTVGQSLTAQPGTWSPTPSFGYQWLRDGTAVSGATTATYAVSAADSGRRVSVRVTGTSPGYVTTTRTSTSVLVPGDPERPFDTIGTASVTGTPSVGQTLTAQTGTWSPAPTFGYQWLRDGAAISGATASTYAVVTADGGRRLAVRVTGSRSGYVTTTQESTAVAVPSLAFTTIGTPAVTGTPAVGQTLTAQPGSWSPTPTFGYEWLRDGAMISGATASTYPVVAADAGRQLAVRVTGSSPGYVPVSQTSAAVAVPLRQFATVGSPTVPGTPSVGSTVTAQPGSWSPTPAFGYTWLRNGSTIAGATSSTYQVASADAGAKIAVRVTGTSAGYVTTVRTSPGVAVPAAAAPPQVGTPGSGTGLQSVAAPRLRGAAHVGGVLRVGKGAWSIAPRAYSFRWFCDGHQLRGRHGQRLRIEPRLVGCRVRARVVARVPGDSASAVTRAVRVHRR